MITEALDVALTLGWWLAGWVFVLAAALTVFLLTGCAVGAWAVRGVWRGVVRPSWARGRARARLYARRTRAHDYEEAA